MQSSGFTSIQERINKLNSLDTSTPLLTESPNTHPERIAPLLATFDGSTHLAAQSGIQFHFCDYLELIDWSGRAIRTDKKGFIDSSRPKLLNALGISPNTWLSSTRDFGRQYSGISGRWDAMCEFKRQHQSGKWAKGKACSNALHPPSKWYYSNSTNIVDHIKYSAHHIVGLNITECF